MDLTAVFGRVLGGRYRAEQLLGSGGMAAVWRGRDLRLDRPVAIKVLAGPGLADPVAFTRFDREARAVARLAHPNIVAVYDFSADDGDPYLVMELVEGRTVAAVLAGGALPLAQALAVATQTCDGLTAAHTAGVIHRDIKPANLILTPSGVVKICDFGIARLQHVVGQTNLTGTATIGTTAYMAPEQVAGGPVDARTDLYALGCTIYAMLTGAPPFAGDTPLSIAQQHLNQPPAPLQTRRADVPAALEALVGQLLAKDPADRPADAGRVKSRLALLASESAVAVSPGPAPKPSAVPHAVAATGLDTPPAAAPVLGPSTPVSAGGGYPRAKRRGRFGAAAVAGVVILAVLSLGTGIALWNAERARSTAERQPTAPPAASALVEPSASPSTSVPPDAPMGSGAQTRSSTPVRPSTPAPPSDPIAAMRASIQRQVLAGLLNPNAADDLHNKVDGIAREINDGDTNETIKKVGELRDKLADLRKDGKLSSAGYDELLGYLDQLPGARP